MSDHSAYIPRPMVDFIHSTREELTNPCICVKFPYKGFEVSLALDSSHMKGDLFRGDIRVYAQGLEPFFKKNSDVTEALFPRKTILYGTVEQLVGVFRRIDRWTKENVK